MNDLYKIGYMDGLTGVVTGDNKYNAMFLVSKYFVGFINGFNIRKEFYKPDLHN